MLAFRLTLAQVEMFFHLCHELNAVTEAERVAVLEMMAGEGDVEGITKTSMSKEEYIKHLASKFGNIVNITSKENLTNG